jgi:S-adenosylmethionine decarboxylase
MSEPSTDRGPSTRGQHWLVEYLGCDPKRLDDREYLVGLLRRAAEAAGAKVVAEAIQPFSPHGMSAVLLIEESHFSLHTWPEAGYAAADFYTCGDCQPERAHAVLLAGVGAARSELIVIERGLGGGGASLAVGEICGSDG